MQAHGVDRSKVDDALLVVSELVSNAIKHARPLPDRTVRVSWQIGPSLLELAVTDGGSPSTPTATIAQITALGGRGLDIVRQLSSGWGVKQEGAGVTVWAALPVTERVLAAR